MKATWPVEIGTVDSPSREKKTRLFQWSWAQTFHREYDGKFRCTHRASRPTWFGEPDSHLSKNKGVSQICRKMGFCSDSNFDFQNWISKLRLIYRWTSHSDLFKQRHV